MDGVAALPVLAALPLALTGAGGGTPLPDLCDFEFDGGPDLSGPPSAFSSLDSGTPPLETTDGHHPAYLRQERYGAPDHDDYAPSLPGEAAFRHSGWSAKRRRIYQALLRTGQSCRRVANFADCGNTLWLHRDGQELALTCNKCHDRLCEPCQRERQAEVTESILLKCHDAVQPLRFVTLTLKHSDTPLGLQIDRLTSCFKLLRQHPDVKSAIAGGVWFLEVKLDKSKARWHPHLHCVVEGSFLDQKTLARAWHHTTGDSYIVDIRAIGSAADRARYVTKYSTKPLHSEVSRDPEKLQEFVTAIKGRRLYQCFGLWSKAVRRTPAKRKLLTPIGHINTVWLDALAGVPDALFWMRIAHGRFPKLRRTYPLPQAGKDEAPPP